ncbi:Flp family type IVb pilin [Streptomyces sp. NPDC013187]|uniref:Flp family type IVb pilin n=1 Tax=Streptomyces sp. NPDC013187 TaxID=3364865 RepID=UPI0036829E91
MPTELGWAQVLLWVQFALTVLYVVTVLSVVTYYSGEIFGILAYDSLPSVAGIYLARRLWRGGVWTSRALIAVQAWIVWLSLGTLLHGDLRGVTQAAIPVAVSVLLRRARSREWFESAPQDREQRRPFSLGRMIRWRRDEGQTAVEYAGLIAVVATIIVALSVGGLGGRIADGIRSAVCSVTGTACPAPQGDGTETGAAGNNDAPRQGDSDPQGGSDPRGGSDPQGGSDAQGDSGTQGGSGVQGGAAGQAGTEAGGTSTGTGVGDTDGGGIPASAQIITYDGAGPNDTVPLAPGPFEDKSLWDDVHDQERHDRTFMDHVRGFFVAPAKSFLADTMDVVSDPVGSVKDTWNGLQGYTTDWWGEKADELGEKWDKGNYVSSVWGWVNSPEDFVSDLAVDTFVDKENWEKGNYGASIGNTVVGVIGIFSPKTITKFTKFEKLAEVGESLDKAADAAQKARKAAEAGDAEGARKAAKEADEAADAAEKQARESGCTIAAPARRIPYGGNPRGTTPGLLTGSSGTGTTVLAAGPSGSPYVVLAQDGCDEEAKEGAQDAREKADEAQQLALEAQAEAAKAAIKQGRLSIDERNIDDFVRNAKKNPGKKEIGKDQATAALDELTDLAGRQNVDRAGASKLGSEVTNARTASRLEEMLAEVRGVRRASEDAAPDSTVHTAVGSEHNRRQVEVAPGETVDVSNVPDADVLYKGRDGRVHLVEVKNTVNPTRQPEFVGKINTLSEWKKTNPGRATRVEIDKPDKWTEVFRPIKGQKVSPAQLMNEKGVDARIGDASFTAKQLGDMQRALEAKYSRGEEIDWKRMNDNPKGALEYLGLG